MSPSTSPPNFPLGSQETEVKVAAGAPGAGQLESRWGEHNATSAGSGLPAAAAGGLMVRSGEGLPREMRAWENCDVWAPGQRKSKLKRKKWREAGSTDSEGHSLPGQWSVPLFKAAGPFFTIHSTGARLLKLKQMKGLHVLTAGTGQQGEKGGA